MPRPMRVGGVPQKSKDFKGSMIRLIKNLKPWKYLMGLALALAMISAILALIAPNKLSKFADLIGEGLVPNTEVLQEIGTEMSKNQIPQDIVIDGVTITVEDQMEMMKLYQELDGETDQNKMLAVMDKLPKSVYGLIEPKKLLKKVTSLGMKGIGITDKNCLAIAYRIRFLRLYSYERISPNFVFIL